MHAQLFSGGLDSYIIWRLLGRPLPVYVLINSDYEDEELQAIARLEYLDDTLAVQRMLGPELGALEECDGHIPFRNLAFAVTAAAHWHPQVIYLGALAGETSRDKSGKFLVDTSRLLSYTEARPVQVVAPFRHCTKTELVRQFLNTYPRLLPILRETRSCYNPTMSGIGCGECMACFRRWVAMSLNGIDETYAHPPWEWGREQANAKALHYLWNARPSEWYGIARNNYQAARALQRVEGYRCAH